jgi:hypothetical protein
LGTSGIFLTPAYTGGGAQKHEVGPNDTQKHDNLPWLRTKGKNKIEKA